ncbi:hypothetical protein GTZ99_14870 [Novosphingobium sp. FSY-8]|uniref:Glycerophosphoryl diester phosphodiesterase membrane domain-containing protein n=1 Tax=Novosphingobium ovatum TaxID=1908523 RepID=A0ABW9XH07_9SPHN|nr:glycerophosphoryl diester phosphodiesterase membrane domain-containing protein [Novosphingobium ovatum]NBC37835.1 hypothetical protein [Novosphingobium ovatum]
MKIDTNLAWQRVSRSVSANLALALPLAGVFSLLPALAVLFFVPQPLMEGDIKMNEVVAAMRHYVDTYRPWLPLIFGAQLAQFALQAAGSLALVALFADRALPTVGDAISIALRRVLPYLAAEFLFTTLIAAIALTLLGAAAASDSLPLLIITGLGLAVVVCYVVLRLLLLAPVMVIERQTNPARALTRSWQLTRGQVGPMLLVAALMTLLQAVVAQACGLVAGALVALVADAAAGRMANMAVIVVVASGFAIYMAAFVAEFHRQLTAPERHSASPFA